MADAVEVATRVWTLSAVMPFSDARLFWCAAAPVSNLTGGLIAGAGAACIRRAADESRLAATGAGAPTRPRGWAAERQEDAGRCAKRAEGRL